MCIFLNKDLLLPYSNYLFPLNIFLKICAIIFLPTSIALWITDEGTVSAVYVKL